MFSRFRSKQKDSVFKAYANGRLLPLEALEDELFSSKAMGDGIAIAASDEWIYAPCSGTIRLVTPTNHAIALENEDGMQVLLHIGLDSERYQSHFFDVQVTVGDVVNQGDVMVEIKKEHFGPIQSLLVPMVILENPKQLQLCHPATSDVVLAKESVILTYE